MNKSLRENNFYKLGSNQEVTETGEVDMEKYQLQDLNEGINDKNNELYVHGSIQKTMSQQIHRSYNGLNLHPSLKNDTSPTNFNFQERELYYNNNSIFADIKTMKVDQKQNNKRSLNFTSPSLNHIVKRNKDFKVQQKSKKRISPQNTREKYLIKQNALVNEDDQQIQLQLAHQSKKKQLKQNDIQKTQFNPPKRSKQQNDKQFAETFDNQKSIQFNQDFCYLSSHGKQEDLGQITTRVIDLSDREDMDVVEDESQAFDTTRGLLDNNQADNIVQIKKLNSNVSNNQNNFTPLKSIKNSGQETKSQILYNQKSLNHQQQFIYLSQTTQQFNSEEITKLKTNQLLEQNQISLQSYHRENTDCPHQKANQLLEDMQWEYAASIQKIKRRSIIDPVLYLRRTANVISGFKLDYSIDPFKNSGLQADEHPGFFFPRLEKLEQIIDKNKQLLQNNEKFAELLEGKPVFIYVLYEKNIFKSNKIDDPTLQSYQQKNSKKLYMHIKYLTGAKAKDPHVHEAVKLVSTRKVMTDEEIEQRMLKVNNQKIIDVEDIEDFLFGGLSSRFWIMKNFINLQKDVNLSPSMCSWNMISIKLKGSFRMIDLVIPNQDQMDILILFLLQQIYKTNQKQSFIQMQLKKWTDNIKSVTMKGKTKQTVLQTKVTKQEPDFEKALLVYKIMRIRMKISYHAWTKGITIKELIFKQILKSFVQLCVDQQKILLDIDILVRPKPLQFTLEMIKKLNETDYIQCHKCASSNKIKQVSQSVDQQSQEILKTKYITDEYSHDKEGMQIQKSTFDKQQQHNRLGQQQSEFSYHELQLRLIRLNLLIQLSKLFLIHKNNPIKDVQMMLKREQLSREVFSKDLQIRNWEYFRIPQEMSQHKLPLSFLFYNALIPLLKSFEDDCLHQYIHFCRDQLDQDLIKKEEKRVRKQCKKEQNKGLYTGQINQLCDKILSSFQDLQKSTRNKLLYCFPLSLEELPENKQYEQDRLMILLKIRDLETQAHNIQLEQEQLRNWQGEVKLDKIQEYNQMQQTRLELRRERLILRKQLNQMAHQQANQMVEIRIQNDPEKEEVISHTAGAAFRFVKKKYGVPKAESFYLSKLPEKELKVLFEKEVQKQRKAKINNKLILFNKFTKMKYKLKYIDSQLQRQYVPKIIKENDFQFLRMQNELTQRKVEQASERDQINSSKKRAAVVLLDNNPTEHICTSIEPYLTSKGFRRMALVQRYCKEEMREMEQQLQNDPEFIQQFNNTYRYLLQKAKHLEKQMLIMEKSKQSMKLQQELREMKDYDDKCFNLERHLHRSYNF